MGVSRKRKNGQPATAQRSRGRTPRRRVAELDLRRTPMQARGQATFVRILDATARLLDDVGGERLTTNLIAKAADVNVATLYQYFPNKQSVLLALFKRQSEAGILLGESRITGVSTAANWRQTIRSAVQAVAEARAGTPGTLPLRQLMRSSPELLRHEQLFAQQIAAVLAQELQAVGVKRERATLVAACAIEALSALLDMWSLDTGGRDDRVVDEAKALLQDYLAPYFDRKGRPAAVARKRR